MELVAGVLGQQHHPDLVHVRRQRPQQGRHLAGGCETRTSFVTIPGRSPESLSVLDRGQRRLSSPCLLWAPAPQEPVPWALAGSKGSAGDGC